MTTFWFNHRKLDACVVIKANSEDDAWAMLQAFVQKEWAEEHITTIKKTKRVFKLEKTTPTAKSGVIASVFDGELYFD